MKRALLAAGLLAAIALGAAAPYAAQTVAKLEVEPRSGTQHQKLDRIERKVDQLLELHRGTPPRPAEPTKPTEPTAPVTPVEPGKPNPFVAWREQGLSLVEVAVWRLGRGLTDAELEQAYAAGYPRPAPPPEGSAGERTGFHVTRENSPRVNTLQNGQPYTFTLASPGTVRVFGVSGTQLDRVNGRAVIGGDDIAVTGTSITLTVEGVGFFGPPQVGVQLVP